MIRAVFRSDTAFFLLKTTPANADIAVYLNLVFKDFFSWKTRHSYLLYCCIFKVKSTQK